MAAGFSATFARVSREGRGGTKPQWDRRLMIRHLELEDWVSWIDQWALLWWWRIPSFEGTDGGLSHGASRCQWLMTGLSRRLRCPPIAAFNPAIIGPAVWSPDLGTYPCTLLRNCGCCASGP